MKDFKIIEIMELFDEDEVIPASEMQRPQQALDREMFEDFNKRNPKAGGGMLVQPGFGGTRQGYKEDLPEGITLRSHSKYPDQKYYQYQIQKGDQFKSNMLKATPENLKRIVDMREEAMNELFPNRTSKTEFTKLRKKYSKLNAEDFSKKLNELNKKTFQGKDFTPGNVINLMSKYKIKSEKASNLKRPIQEIKKIIRESSGGVEFIKKFGDDENMLRKKAYTVSSMANKKTATFAKGASNESKQWLSLFRASNGGDRIKMIGTFDGKDISNIDNWPRNEKGKIDWSIKGPDGEPAWKSVKFVDTKAPVKNATFEWNTEKKPNGQYKYVGGNLKNQIDNVFGKGFFRKSTAAYDLQAMSGTKNIMYKGKSLPPKQVIAIKMIENEYKNKYGKMPSKDYVSRRLNFVSFQEAHHPYGVANDPYFTELASKAANSRLTLIEEKYKKLIKENPANKNKLINNFKKEVKDLSAEFGNIRTGQVIDTGGLFGKKATPAELFQSGLTQANINKGSPLYKELEKSFAAFSANPKCRVTFGKKDGGRINYANGPASLSECAISGRNRLEKVIKTGVKLGPQEGALATQIIKAGRSLGSAFTLSGLFGPAALAFTAAAEAGIVGYDMLTTGKTFKETIGDSLFNYALGDKTKIDPDKELIKRFGTLPGMTDDKLLGIKNVLDQTNTLNTILKQDLKVGNLEDEVKAFREQPKDQFVGPDDEMLQTDQAIRAEQKLKDEQKNLENLLINYRSQPPVGLSMEDTILGDMESGKFQDTKQDLDKAIKAAEIQKLESKGPVFMGKVFPKFEEGRQEDLLNLRAVDNPAVAFSQANQFMYPYGLAGGGIAKLAGIDEGPQTVSMNPDSQGLQSLKNRVKNI